MTVLIVRAALANALARTSLTPALEFGVPLFEESGVPARRAAFIHAYDAEALAELQEILNANPTAEIQSTIPSDWRYTPPE